MARQRLEALTARPDFWDNPDSAREITGKIAGFKAWIGPIEGIGEQLDETRVLVEMAEEEGGEAATEAESELARLEVELRAIELRKMLFVRCMARVTACAGTDVSSWKTEDYFRRSTIPFFQ